MPAVPAVGPAPPALIQGRYRLRRLIGRGGMSEVWRAEDESLARRVAVKCLRLPGRSGGAGLTRAIQERFRREARVAAALQHRGITVVHDFGEHDGVLFLVMELLDGRNLRQVLAQSGGRLLQIPELIDIALQLASALAYAHERGVVHRDLKPTNIMRLGDGTVKVCDFGIARLGDDSFSSRLTGTGVALGAAHYMSPEQINASVVDQRSDLYALGCVLYELATGKPPFDLGDAWSILVAHRDHIPEPPRARRPDLPVELERLILDLLAKDPADRPQQAAEVTARLTARPQQAAAPQQQAWHPSAPGPGPVPAPAPADVPSPSGQDDGLSALAARQAAADSLGQLGLWTEAYDLHLSVAAERERIQGPEHPDTLAGRHEAAYWLTRLGRAEEALPLHTQVAEVRGRVLGPDHPDTLAARHETAYALSVLGRHGEARREFAAVLDARERTVGPDHPDTLRCKHNLAYNLAQLGRTEDAYTATVEVADARSRVLGAEHPDTLGTRYEVAFLLGQDGRWEEALEVYREVADARERTLGPDHPDTLAARYEIGICLIRLARNAEALAVLRELVASRTRSSGAADRETLRARQALGVSLGRLGRWEEALAVAREVAVAREHGLGPDDEDTLDSKREVAVCLGWLGRWREALVVYREVAGARERVLGRDHPDTLSSRHDEARCLEHLGRIEEAQALYRRTGGPAQTSD
ncbi:serine/threonine-protein kinase [Streptomyces sp. NBC_00448]